MLKHSSKKRKKTEDENKDEELRIKEYKGEIKRGMRNDFVVTSKSGKKFSLPVTLAVIFTIAGIEIVPLALIIAFFCGCRFSFNGPDLGTSKINDEMSNIRYSYTGK